MSGHPLSLHNIFGLPGDCTEDCNADIVALCEGYTSFPEEPVPPPYPMPAVPLLEDTGFDQNRIDALFKLELNPDSPLYGCGETTNVALPSGASDPDRIPLDTLLDAMALPPRPAALPPRPAAPPPRTAAPRPATPPPRPAASPPRPIAPPPRPALTPMQIGTALAGFNASDPMAIVRLSKRKAVVLGEGVDERSSRYAQPSPTMSSLRAQAAAGPSRVPLSHQPTPQELAAVEQPQEDLEGEVAADLADERPRPAKRARKPRKGCATDEKIQKAVYIAPGRSVTMQCPCCPHVFSLDDIQQAWEHWDTKHAASTDGEEAKCLAVGTSIGAGTSSPEEGADPARRENHGKEKEKKRKQKAYGQCPALSASSTSERPQSTSAISGTRTSDLVPLPQVQRRAR
ncbi:hypothetical protein C8T65DRAFT_693787 [Cerioporus squamosus]|nr:hypothetical protein C8T65DRAFT_693787 [Cerioporus squamosus]